ncbi:UNVERIFIED_CONTAM: hypothetical protein GTU68_065925 [Idotea baltica]|nr:hypothetical protein [Idotea baltica]
MKRILFVEDEEHIRDAVKLNLELENYEVICAGDGPTAIKYHSEQHFDLVLLDIMIPDINGLQVCEKIRLTDQETPIVMVTAKDAPIDKIHGLKRGADDYITKPFSIEEVLLRIKNLIRLTAKTEPTTIHNYSFGDNAVNFKTFEATNNNREFTLTKKEAMLLKLLIDRKNEVVSRQQILQTVWGYDVFPSTRTIDNFILSFRKYFEVNPKEPKYFKSIRGIGYKFVVG